MGVVGQSETHRTIGQASWGTSLPQQGRDEVYKEAHKRKDAHTGIFYVGKLPEDLVVVL